MHIKFLNGPDTGQRIIFFFLNWKSVQRLLANQQPQDDSTDGGGGKSKGLKTNVSFPQGDAPAQSQRA